MIGFVASQYLGGGTGTTTGVSGGFGEQGGPAQIDTAELGSECRTGADANAKLDCAIVADINSIQGYWSGGGYARAATGVRGAAPRYETVDTTFFTGGVRTACGSADSSAGPFYCPGDNLVYIDLSFYEQLRTQFGAQGGGLTNASVLAHEYGHHVQSLLDPDSFTHGSSEQRKRWLTTGYTTGDPTRCTTFSTAAL